jgi:hypothetical protein
MKGPIAEIARIRVRNNELWMKILELALEHAPAETKKVLTEIRRNDLMVSECVEEIIDDEDRD